jgi:tetratricopeptide (TPR) repeat protein
MIRSVPGTRAGRLVAAIAVLAVVGAWSVAWRDLDRTPLTCVPVLDEAHYLREGAAIAGGRLLPERPAVMSPLYPYLVAATGSGRTLDAHGVRLGPPPWGLRAAQLMMWLGTAWLLLREGRRLLPPALGWLPALLWLLYRPGAVLAGSALMEVPLAFLATLGLSLAVAPGTGRALLRRAVLAGCCLGLAALLRGTALLLLVPALLAIGGRRRRTLALGAALLVMLPFALFNTVHLGRPAGPSLNAGINLYIGNGGEAGGLFQTFRGLDVGEDPSGRRFLSEKLGRTLADEGAADRAWAGEAWKSARQRPLRILGLWLHKLRLHFVGTEIPQISPHTAWTREAPVLRLFWVPYGLLAAGGLAGVALALRREPRLRPWVLGLLLIVAVQSLFFVVSRYRLVLVPGLALLTGAAAAVLLRSRGRALAAAGAVVLAAVLAVQPWGLDGQFARLEAAGDLNEAVRWSRLADARQATAGAAAADAPERRRAEALYRAALARDPVHPEAWRGLAGLLLRSGRDDEALACLREGMARADPAEDVRRDFAALAVRSGEAAGALPVLMQLLRDDPEDHELLHQAAVALAETGRAGEAEALARRLTAAAPDDPRGWLDLGVILARDRRYPEARAAFADGLKRRPDHALLRSQLARVDSLLARR